MSATPDAMSSRAPATGGTHKAAGTRDARRSFWTVVRRAALAAIAIHVGFLALFAGLGVPALVWTNVAGIVVYAVCLRLLARRRNRAAGALAVGEVVVHAAVAVAAIGWDSGFAYYLLILVAPLTIAPTGSRLRRLAPVAALGAFYVALDAWGHRVAPLHPVDATALAAVRGFNIVCTLALMALLARTYFRLVSEAERAMRMLATTDPLTGLHNRRRLLEIASGEQMRNARHPRPACVLLCDIDHFKRVNDTFGHDAGDRLLQAVAGVLKESLRAQDAVARWGGEEFLVLLTDADVDTALQTAERLRVAVARAAVPDVAGMRVSITIGVAPVEAGTALDAAVAHADRALYRGKAAGRDRVELERGAEALPA